MSAPPSPGFWCDLASRPPEWAIVKSLRDLMGPALRKTSAATALAPLWEELVGPVLAAHTRPVRWEGQRLIIRCDSLAWRTALEPEARALAVRFGDRLGDGPPPHLVFECP